MKVGEKYKCDLCGNVVEVKVYGGGELYCCGHPMDYIVDAKDCKPVKKK